MKLYGLIGHPVSHSFSKEFFTRFFSEQGLSNHRYELIDLASIEEFSKLIELTTPSGLNVTIPYKVAVLPYLDECDTAAEKIKAVNCIATKNGKLIGYNTDYAAFRDTLIRWNLPTGISALVFGNGGSSKAVQYALSEQNIPFSVISRTGNLTYAELSQEHFVSHRLLINTTPLGMYPEVNAMPPIPLEYVNQQHYVYDLIYNPAETRFLTQCRMQGAAIKNGMEMLEAQARLSWEIWNR